MQAKILQVNANTTLVQYRDDDGVPQRVYLPSLSGKVGDLVEIENPERGVPYAELVFSEDVLIPASTLNAALRDTGIWTKDDLNQHPQLYVQAVTGALGLSLNQILMREQL